MNNYQVHMLPIADILQDTDWNCRGPIAPIEVVDLMKDIDKSGLLSPVIVIPWDKNGFKYKLIAGFCRTKAFQQLNKKEIPAFIHAELDDARSRILNLRENLQRRDLNIVQEANALKPLRQQGWSEVSLAKEFGRSLQWVKIRIMLLQLEPEIQAVAASGIFTQEHIKRMQSLSKEQRFELVRKIKTKTFKLDDVQPSKPMPKIINRNAKIPPTANLILTVQEKIYDLVGPSVLTRCLAWCAGEISYNEFREDILLFIKDEGKDPKGYRDDV